MAGLQVLRDVLPDQWDAELLARFAFVPGRLTYAFDPAGGAAQWTTTSLADPARRQEFEVARFFLGDGSLQPWTVLSYALLHGGWTHLGLNSIWLVAFGTPVARRLGPLRFAIFMTAGALIGAVTHYGVEPTSLQPLIGASAAVSACMGAALRFMFRPPAREPDGTAAGSSGPSASAPRLPLIAVFGDRRALAFIGVWFLTNIVTGAAAVPFGLSDAPIAWQAHIGGFLMGLLAFPLFDRNAPASRDLGEPG